MDVADVEGAEGRVEEVLGELLCEGGRLGALIRGAVVRLVGAGIGGIGRG